MSSLTSHFNHGARQRQSASGTTSEQRIIEDSGLPVVQCDSLVLKDVAATDGLKVLSMYVKTL